MQPRSKVFTGNDVEKLLRNGGKTSDIPGDAVLTPSAREVIAAANGHGVSLSPSYRGTATGYGVTPARATYPRAERLPDGVPAIPPEPIVPSFEYNWTPGGDPTSPEEIQRFFYSDEIMELKRQMVRVGHKMWGRSMVDGNGGNITLRVGDNLVLCTPTLRSKGELTIDDIALVDMDGVQKAGWRKRTSECNTHLAIMKVQPAAKSCIHGHPPYSTAFAVASVRPPTCLCSEAEIFTGPIEIVPYETPGSPENAVAVAKIAVDHPAFLLENHGVMVWGTDVEDAYWKLENMETACQTIWVASQLNGGKLHTIPFDKMQDIFSIREQLGMKDPRAGMKECELCDNAEFRPGAVCSVADGQAAHSLEARQSATFHPDAEKLVQQITDQILARS